MTFSPSLWVGKVSTPSSRASAASGPGSGRSTGRQLDDLAVAELVVEDARPPGRGPRARPPSARRPVSSRAAVRPASPAPTTTTSASYLAARSRGRTFDRPSATLPGMQHRAQLAKTLAAALLAAILGAAGCTGAAGEDIRALQQGRRHARLAQGQAAQVRLHLSPQPPLALAGRAVGLHWKGWGRRVARARGTGVSLHADANGTFDRFPARVRGCRDASSAVAIASTPRVTFFDGDDRRSWSVPPRSC